MRPIAQPPLATAPLAAAALRLPLKEGEIRMPKGTLGAGSVRRFFCSACIRTNVNKLDDEDR